MENSTEPRKEMLSWHKPQVQKLTINVDTQGSNNISIADFGAEG